MKSVTSFFYSNRSILIIVFFIICFSVVHSTFAFAIHTGNDADHAANTSGDAGGISTWLANMVLTVALGIGGIFSWLGGMLLNGAVNQTILNAGNIIGDSGQSGLGTGIRSMWVVIRDIFNIVFIFSFIYIGIKTILNADDSGAKRSLGLLIVAALLINFSLYVTQVIIDFSNIAAIQVYNQITSGGVLIGAGLPNDPAGGALIPTNYGVSGAFANTIRLTSLFGGHEIEGIGAGQILIYALMAMVFLIIAGIVFAMGGILLIRRFISLIIYMILSPVMFAGWIFPAFMGYQQKWRKGFLEQAFFAPAFLFMIYLSLMVLQSLRTSFGITTTGYSSMLKTGDVDSFSIFLFFCMGIGFLYASIKVGEMMSVAGASGMVKSLNSMKGMAQSLAYRNTVGRGMRQGIKVLDAIDRSADGGNKAARLTRFLGADEALRRGAEGIQNKGINGGRGLEAVEKDQKTAKARTARSNQITTISDAIKTGGATMERAVKDASSAQIVEMFKDDKDQIISVAGELSEGQVKAIMDDKEIDDTLKSKLGGERAIQIGNRLVKNNKLTRKDAAGNDVLDANGNPEMYDGEMSDVIGKADGAELQALGFQTAFDNAGQLSSKQIEDWKDLTSTEKTQLKAARKDQLWTEFTTPGQNGQTGAEKLFKRIKSDEERSKLPDKILKDPAAAQFLNTNVLTKIVDNPGISDTDRTEIKRLVTNLYPTIAAGVNDPIGRANHKKYSDFFSKNNAGQRY